VLAPSKKVVKATNYIHRNAMGQSLQVFIFFYTAQDKFWKKIRPNRFTF